MKVIIKPPENREECWGGEAVRVSHTYYRFVETAALGTTEGDKDFLLDECLSQ